VLSIDELRQVWKVAGEMKYPFGPMFRLLILTGQRRGEVAAMKWTELDLDRGLWTIPGSRTKNERGHVVHLHHHAIRELSAIPRRGVSNLVFTTNGKTAVSGFSKGKKRLDKLSGIEGWTIHDLRRSLATHATESLEINNAVVDKILNHVSGAVKGIAAVYQRGEYLGQRQAAMKAWEKFLIEPPEPVA
jgi:integrase